MTFSKAQIEAMDSFIALNHKTMLQSEMAQELGVSTSYVSVRCRALGLKKERSPDTLRKHAPDPKNENFIKESMAGKQSLSLLRKPWTREGLGV